jgi:hypothetical protein
MIVNDDSSIVNKRSFKLIDDAIVNLIYCQFVLRFIRLDFTQLEKVL